MNELDGQADLQRWSVHPARKAMSTLRVLLNWLGADAPIHERDIRALVKANPTRFSGRRVIQFREARGHLVPDPEYRGDIHERALTCMLEQLPHRVAEELAVWVRVERGAGHRRRRRTRSFHSIRRYLTVLMPTLDGWTQRIESLREITADDITAAIATRRGNPARSIHIVLRNVFRALQQERVIFRDPTRGLVFPGIVRVPAAVPSDRLRGILDRTDDDLRRLVIVLVGIHALRGVEIRSLLLADLDLARGRLTVRRPGRRHTLWLDTLTHQLAAQWLVERHRRWPVSANPHLLINQQTALNTGHPSISQSSITKAFNPHDLTMEHVRQDRILNEAQHSADPLHLIRLFGISDETAMRYITAAHPERTSALPR
ncbi:site-specific integrase [Rhodococcus sp. NPDC054953]